MTTDPSFLTLTDPSGGRAQISLHGAHVTSWVDGSGRERLYLSRRARYEPGESIRGGIPVIFPQFASQGPLPKHGLVRTRRWTVTEQEEGRATLSLGDDDDTRAVWPHRFRAELLVSLEAGLTVRLNILNTGSSVFSFTSALHTYFAVDDVRDARVVGLTGKTYYDNLRDYTATVDTEPSIRIPGKVDRVYRQAGRTVRLAGTGAPGELELQTEGFGDWVVWNPWAEETATLSDMEPEDFNRMLCVEAARITEPVTLQAGEAWSGVKIMRLLD